VRTAELRSWQRDAFALYLERLALGQKTLLWEATPGAGKTTAALQVVLHQLKHKLARRVLVVVPTSHLRVQWSRAALQFGLQLESSRSTGLSRDFHGAVVTYQQFGRQDRWLRELASNAVVVLDEVHHAGEGLTWGDALRDMLSASPFILSLSGTAFRSDGNPIPFVHYDQHGFGQPDFTYSYTRAVDEGVCRPTAFFTYGGEVSWSDNGNLSSASFSDSLDHTYSARRLRAALTPEVGWIRPMLQDAHDMLSAIRAEDRSAGGLIVCMDRDHARKVARLITEMTREKPTVVLSDDSNASKKIKQFSDSSSEWLVACNMVSEGVDIPRLRVGVYATTIRTKLYFRQFLGRVVRRQAHISGNQVAKVYLPADPILRVLAEEIETETRHILRTSEASTEDRTDREYVPSEKTWNAIAATNSGLDAVIVHGNQLSLFGGSVPAQQVMKAIQHEVEVRRDTILTRTEKKEQLAQEIRALVGQLHRRSGKPHSAIHGMLNRSQSVNSQTLCTEEQLVRRKALLEQMINVS